MSARRRNYPRSSAATSASSAATSASSAATRGAAAVAAILLAAIVGACGSSATSTPTPAPSSQVAQATGFGDTPSPAATSAPPESPAGSKGNATTLGRPVGQGGDLCGLLGPGDFAAAGVAGAMIPVENSDDSGNYYCVYAGDSGATGGIEFDAFASDPNEAYQTMTEADGITTADATGALEGADKAGTIQNGPGGMAAIAVCDGQFCFDIEFPTTSAARTELISLAGHRPAAGHRPDVVTASSGQGRGRFWAV